MFVPQRGKNMQVLSALCQTVPHRDQKNCWGPFWACRSIFRTAPTFPKAALKASPGPWYLWCDGKKMADGPSWIHWVKKIGKIHENTGLKVKMNEKHLLFFSDVKIVPILDFPVIIQLMGEWTIGSLPQLTHAQVKKIENQGGDCSWQLTIDGCCPLLCFFHILINFENFKQISERPEACFVLSCSCTPVHQKSSET